jgi:prepilin-type N-terminal cleavage/methylation domain-containing protein
VKIKKSKSGLTLVEVMIAMFLVSIAAVIVYTEMLMAYRTLARSRARLEAQSIAFDHLWAIYNTPLANMPIVSETYTNFSTPEWSMMSTGGWVECQILAETNPPVLPDPVWYWDIVVQVWPPTNTLLQIGTNPLSRYAIRRYRGER